MVEVINPLSRSAELTPSDLHLLSLLQDLNHKKERDYDKEIRPLFAGFPPSLSEFTREHLETYEAALKASGSFPPEIAVEFDKLKKHFFPLPEVHPALEACHLGNIYDAHHNKSVRDHYQQTQENHANVLALSRAVSALEKAKLSQEGDVIDLSAIKEDLETGARIYTKLTEGASILDVIELPEDLTQCTRDDVDDLLRKLGEGKILEQGRGPQILTLMRKEVELMLIVFQALQKILEGDAGLKRRIAEKMSR